MPSVAELLAQARAKAGMPAPKAPRPDEAKAAPKTFQELYAVDSVVLLPEEPKESPAPMPLPPKPAPTPRPAKAGSEEHRAKEAARFKRWMEENKDKPKQCPKHGPYQDYRCKPCMVENTRRARLALKNR